MYLQLRSRLCLLKNRLHLGGLHNIALDLQLSAHEQFLCIRLAADQRAKVLVAEGEGDVGLLALWCGSLSNSARLLEVNVPRLLLVVVFECEAEDGAALLDGVGAVGV